MWIAKNDLPSRKSYKLIFTDKTFEIVMFPIVNSPKCNLIDVNKDEINGKLYEKKSSLIGNKADYDESGQ